MSSIGLLHCYEVNEGSGHVPYLGNDAVYDSTLYMISHFFAQFVCDTFYECDYEFLTSKEEISADNLSIYPNPLASGQELKSMAYLEKATVTLVDCTGKLVFENW
jgi:hypothetical protein